MKAASIPIVVVVVVAFVLAGSALAAQLAVTSRTTGGGNTAVVACDTDGFLRSYTTSRGNVTAVTIGGIADPACEGGTVRVTIKNASGSSIASAGPQTIAADGDAVDNSVTMTTSSQPAAGQVAGIDIAVEGP
jgi:hypothetical protein